jgi:RimJ/RimL family protein N-acetyltransferase
VGLSRIDRLHGTAEFGILVGEADATGKGVATEAGRQILRIAFAELNLNRVYLHVFADNARAATLYRRLDFVEEGILRQHVRKDGAYRNVLVMGLLAEEWRAAQS